jgi:hypothetical protein
MALLLVPLCIIPVLDGRSISIRSFPGIGDSPEISLEVALRFS